MGLRTKIPAQIQIEEAELLGGMDQTTGPAGQPQNLKLWVHMQLLKCKLCNTGVYLCLLDRKFFCLYTRSDISALSVSLPIFSVFSLLLLLSQIAWLITYLILSYITNYNYTSVYLSISHMFSCAQMYLQCDIVYPATEVGVGWLLCHYDKTWQMCLGSGVPDLPHSIRLTQSERRAVGIPTQGVQSWT